VTNDIETGDGYITKAKATRKLDLERDRGQRSPDRLTEDREHIRP